MTDSFAIAMDRVARIELRIRQVDPTWSSALGNGPTSFAALEPAAGTPFATASREAGPPPGAATGAAPTVLASGPVPGAATLPGDPARSSGVAPGTACNPLSGARDPRLVRRRSARFRPRWTASTTPTSMG